MQPIGGDVTPPQQGRSLPPETSSDPDKQAVLDYGKEQLRSPSGARRIVALLSRSPLDADSDLTAPQP
ncbi:hypothetical protein GCM10010234_81180 [Streptomyces hawaiiensis]|uniref:hypothetical protein n=1 Tax=Streptomyces hawaiiensis TaxID=67305 RepID=UPI0031D9169F